MSQENVKIVRRAYARMGDLLHLTTAQIDRVFREVDEHFEFRLPADYPEGEMVFRGRDGIDELITLLRDTWREWRVEPERFLDAGGTEWSCSLASWPWVRRVACRSSSRPRMS